MPRKTPEARKEYEKMRNLRDGEKRKAARKAYYSKNKKAHKDVRLKNCYGLEIGEYDAMLEKQKHYCLACGDHETLSRYKCLVVDHDHRTGKIRGLICDACNRTIGHARENLSRLEACILYLRDAKL